MNGLKAEVDPAEVGLDADRLRRIDANFARYVDDGLLAGWLVTVVVPPNLPSTSATTSRIKFSFKALIKFPTRFQPGSAGLSSWFKSSS